MVFFPAWNIPVTGDHLEARDKIKDSLESIVSVRHHLSHGGAHLPVEGEVQKAVESMHHVLEVSKYNTCNDFARLTSLKDATDTFIIDGPLARRHVLVCSFQLFENKVNPVLVKHLKGDRYAYGSDDGFTCKYKCKITPPQQRIIDNEKPMDVQMLSWVLQHGPSVDTLKGALKMSPNTHFDGLTLRNFRNKLQHGQPLSNMKSCLDILIHIIAKLKVTSHELVTLRSYLDIFSDKGGRINANLNASNDANTIDNPPVRLLAPPAHMKGLVGRDQEVASVKMAICADEYSRVLVHGVMGVGKTAIALECCHQLLANNELPGFHCTRVHGSSSALLQSGIRQFGRQVSAAIRRAKEQVVLAQSLIWLKENPNWLLLVDDAQGPAMVLNMLPAATGRVLLTTMPLAQQADSQVTFQLAIQLLDPASSFALLQRDLKRDNPALVEIAYAAADVEEFLAAELCHLPLAICIASRLLATGTIKVRDLIKEFHGVALAETQKVHDPKNLRSVHGMVQLALRQVPDEHRELCNLVMLAAATVGPGGLWPELVSSLAELDNGPLWISKLKVLTPLSDPELLNQICQQLRTVGLLRVDAEACYDRIGEAMMLLGRDILPEVVEDVILCLTPEIEPHCEFINFDISQNQDLGVFAQRAAAVVAFSRVSKIDIDTWVYDFLGHWHHSYIGDYTTAVQYFRQSLAANKSATSYLNLARALQYNDCFYKANEMFQETERIDLLTLGRHHPDTATTYNSWGVLLYQMANYKQAMELHKKALEIYENSASVGPNHEKTATAHENIGNILHALARYDEAIYHFERARKIKGAKFVEGHPDVVSARSSLQATKLAAGQVVTRSPGENLRIRLVGKDHPAIATDCLHDADQLNRDKQYAAAVKKYLQALKMDKTKLGDDHSDTAVTYNGLGMAYMGMKQSKNALKCINKAITIANNRLGPEHPTVAAYYANLGTVYLQEQDSHQAIDALREAVRIDQKAPVDDLPQTADHHYWIGKAYLMKMSLVQARHHLMEAQRIFVGRIDCAPRLAVVEEIMLQLEIEERKHPNKLRRQKKIQGRHDAEQTATVQVPFAHKTEEISIEDVMRQHDLDSDGPATSQQSPPKRKKTKGKKAKTRPAKANRG